MKDDSDEDEEAEDVSLGGFSAGSDMEDNEVKEHGPKVPIFQLATPRHVEPNRPGSGRSQPEVEATPRDGVPPGASTSLEVTMRKTIEGNTRTVIEARNSTNNQIEDGTGN